jgi:2-hydroxychromene-2-carboxylate isomerase
MSCDQYPLLTSPTVELWFDFGSNYSYLTVMRIEEVACRYGAAVVWKPFLLGPIFESFGWSTSPFVLQEQKGAYMWKDMVRQCDKYALPWMKPSHFPRRALLPLRVALLGANEPWIAEFSRRVMQLNFVADREIDTPDAVGEVLESLGLPTNEILSAAQSSDNKQRLRGQTEEAQGRGVFGAPSMFVGTEMFWGNDRLEDALSYATSLLRLR